MVYLVPDENVIDEKLKNSIQKIVATVESIELSTPKQNMNRIKERKK